MNCTLFSRLRRTTIQTSACIAAVAVALATTQASELVFRLPDVVVNSGGQAPVSGTLQALLDLTGNFVTNPPSVSSINVAFELTGHPVGITFGTPQDPPTNGVIPNGVVFSGATQLPHVIRFAKDSGVPTPALDGGLMVHVPFTVAAGTAAGNYPVRFITGNELGSGDAVALPITLVNGSISVVPIGASLAGDYNRNGVVDAADYGVWRNAMGQTGAGLAADGNGNNLIDAADYSIWPANFGRTLFGSGATVPGIPEPTTLLLAAVAGLVMALAGRHNRASWRRLA